MFMELSEQNKMVIVLINRILPTPCLERHVRMGMLWEGHGFTSSQEMNSLVWGHRWNWPSFYGGEKGLNENVLALSCDNWNSGGQNLDGWIEVEDRASLAQHDDSVGLFLQGRDTDYLFPSVFSIRIFREVKLTESHHNCLTTTSDSVFPGGVFWRNETAAQCCSGYSHGHIELNSPSA